MDESTDESRLVDPTEANDKEEQKGPGPGRKTVTTPDWVRVADGIWRKTKARRPWLYERPTIRGRSTYKALATTSVKLAREELARRRALRQTGAEPTDKRREEAAKDEQLQTAGDVIRFYLAAGCPDRKAKQRQRQLGKDAEVAACDMLLGFWDDVPIESITLATCDDYRDWRVKKINPARKVDGMRTVDLDLTTLSNAFRFGVRKAKVKYNPVAERDRYRDSNQVKHCREFMPKDADELHEVAGKLFRNPSTVVLGFQFLAEAYTGLRTSEILKWGSGDFGKATPKGDYLNVWRCKGQHLTNPYTHVHEGLQALLAAHAKWKREKYGDQQPEWFFPGRSPERGGRPVKPVCVDALSHALKRLADREETEAIKLAAAAKKGGRLTEKERTAVRFRKYTSHGARAFYVTVRRSHGVVDAQIADEIGHTTPGSTLEKVYGGIPPNWRTDGPKLSWLPIKVRPAWEFIVDGHETNKASTSSSR